MENEEKASQKLDLFLFLNDFLRQAKRMWILGLVFILVFSAAMTFLGHRSHRDYYEAYASFTVRVSNPLYASVSSYNEKTAQVMQDTFPSILTSNLLQNRVMEELGISHVPSMSVSATAQSSILTLTVRDTDPQRAYDVLNAVIRCYPEVSEFVVGSTVLVLLDESGVPTQPVSAYNARYHILRGALVGLVVWFALVAALALLKNTVHSEDELRKTLNIPCLGLIPAAKITKKMPHPLIHKLKSNTGFVESVRLLRLRVEKAMEEEGKKVLLVSSAIPGEGKTTIAANLAISLAKKGKQVLLLDCDLRNPSIAKTLSTKTHPLTSENNLVDILNGEIKVGDAFQSTGLEHLDVITGGPGIQAERTSLLSQKNMSYLIQAAREHSYSC